MLSQELLDIATRFQVYLERLKAGQLKESDPLFARLLAELVDVLGRLDDPDLGILSAVEVAALVKAVEDSHANAYQTRLNALANTLKDLASYSREFELESLDNVTVDEITPDDGGEGNLWPLLLLLPMSATGKLLQQWLGSWMSNEVTRAGDLVRKATSQGWSVSQLTTAFRGTKAQAYTDGLLGSAKRNTATTINTAVQHVATGSRAITMERTKFKVKGVKQDSEGEVTSISGQAEQAANNLGITVGTKLALLGYRWVSILDRVTSAICRSLDGQVFAFGKGPTPPAHPNCRSSIIAEILGRWLKRDAAGRFAGRDSRNATGAAGAAPVAGSSTYYEWLKTQPAAFQDDALGPVRGKLFREGGLSAEAFARLNLGKNFQPLTLDEMRKLKPNAFRKAGI